MAASQEADEKLASYVTSMPSPRKADAASQPVVEFLGGMSCSHWLQPSKKLPGEQPGRRAAWLEEAVHLDTSVLGRSSGSILGGSSSSCSNVVCWLHQVLS